MVYLHHPESLEFKARGWAVTLLDDQEDFMEVVAIEQNLLG